MANQSLSLMADSFSVLPVQNPAEIYLAGLAPTGRRSMACRLKVIAGLFGSDPESFPWSQLHYKDVVAIREALQQVWDKPNTINAGIKALRGVVKAAFNLSLMSAEEYQRIKNVPLVNGERLPTGRALSIGEIKSMLDACDYSPIGSRDAALIALMYAIGLRRDEIVSLDMDNYNDGELKVIGKGNKERLLYVDNGAEDALIDWLFVRGDNPGPLFYPINKGGIIQYRRMSDQAVYNMLVKRAELAKVKRFSPHDLRRTFITELLERGADPLTVMKLAGHANVQTTVGYDRRDEHDKKKAIGLLHVPYKKRL